MREGWKKEKFEDVFDLQMGKTPSRDNPSYWDGTNTWVSISDMKDKKYISKSKEQISDIAVKDSGIKQVKKGTAIMSFKLSIGKTAIAEEDLFTNEAIMAFNVRDGYGITPDYIYYYLRGYKWDGANKAVMGATLNKKTIASNYFSYPSLPEQERIVAELDCLSDISEKQKQQLKELDNLAQAIFYDMFGDPIANERGWEIKTLAEVCDVRDGTHDSPKYLEESDYVLITSKNITSDGEIDFSTANCISREDYDAINKRSYVDFGDIIMAMIGTIGKPIIVKKTDRKFCIKNVALIKFSTSTVVLNTYIQSLLSSSVYEEYIHSQNKGGTQKFIALGTIRKLPIPTPSLSFQQEFASKIEAIEKQKELIKQSLAETEILFNSRMDYYFN